MVRDISMNSSTMHWQQLLSTRRLGQRQMNPKEGRTDFNTDHDRIVYSSAFRRLQDKTQVFPLAETDFVRTRLTHSLEASNIGRTLGTLVGREILKKHALDNIVEDDFGAIVATATLAHDLGNPPFGHSGENAIRQWFNSPLGQQILQSLSSDAQRADFMAFEGNGQGFRILNTLQYPDRPYGMRLTCATLGAFMKYPCTAEQIEKAPCPYSKHGLFAAETHMFADVAKELGLLTKTMEKPDDFTASKIFWVRHPLTYLVEAADDISYTIADIEDGFRRGLVPYEHVRDMLTPLVTIQDSWWRTSLNTMENQMEQVEFLRALAVGCIARSVASCFMEHEDTLLKGEYIPGGLTSAMQLAKPFSIVGKANFTRIYQTAPVVEIEAAGFEVMDKLLTEFGGALFRHHQGNANQRDKTILKLFPRRHKSLYHNLYHTMLEATDFVSGMTDTSAVSLYKKLTGMNLLKG